MLQNTHILWTWFTYSCIIRKLMETALRVLYFKLNSPVLLEFVPLRMPLNPYSRFGGPLSRGLSSFYQKIQHAYIIIYIQINIYIYTPFKNQDIFKKYQYSHPKA